jgi:NADPH-dependent 2,4-dienoyl-CoA reductase/sulfur reductase-like enzyme
MIMPMYVPRGCRVELGAKIKKLLKVPLSIVGRINDPHLARDIIAEGKADLVDLGRQMIADPYFPQKIAEGKIEDIRQCIACNYCHGKRIRAIKQIRCAINPWAGREAELKEIRPASAPQRIMVIGGGIAGLEAARWLRRRGHRVSLYEKSHQLGGQGLLAAMPPNKGEIQTFIDFLKRQAEKLGIEIHLNQEVTPDFVVQQKPNVAVAATGGRQIQPRNIPINPKMRSIYAWEILSGKEKNLGNRVVVLGGGFAAAEITEFMCERRMAEEITIVEMREAIAFDMELLFRQMLIARLREFGVKMVPNFLVQEVTATEVIGRDAKNKRIKKMQADCVVIALGTESIGFLVETIKQAGIKVHIIGDAHEPRGIAEAVRDGYLAGIST